MKQNEDAFAMIITTIIMLGGLAFVITVIVVSLAIAFTNPANSAAISHVITHGID